MADFTGIHSGPAIYYSTVGLVLSGVGGGRGSRAVSQLTDLKSPAPFLSEYMDVFVYGCEARVY